MCQGPGTWGSDLHGRVCTRIYVGRGRSALTSFPSSMGHQPTELDATSYTLRFAREWAEARHAPALPATHLYWGYGRSILV